MGKIATNRGLSGAAAATVLSATLVTMIDEPASAPNDIPGTAHATFDYTPQVASVAVSTQGRPGGTAPHRGPASYAAPLGETNRQAANVTAPVQLKVAFSTAVADLVDGGLEQAFEQTADLDLVLNRSGRRTAIDLVRQGQVDLALYGGTLSRRDLHAGLRQTPIGLELFAVAVATNFPLQSLTQAQVRQVLSGQVQDWQSLGCNSGHIVVIAPAQPGLAERASTTLILGDSFAADAIRVADESEAASQLGRNPNGIAVVRVGAVPPQGMKLLQIDWTPPTADAYRYGSYRYGMPLHLISNGVVSGRSQRFVDFVNSADGRELMGHRLQLPR